MIKTNVDIVKNCYNNSSYWIAISVHVPFMGYVHVWGGHPLKLHLGQQSFVL